MSKSVFTEVEGQKLKLTNLAKTLYPNASITKAEVVSYYLKVSKYMGPYLKLRPLTLIRFPDGLGSEKSFYTKNKPSWTPEWMPTTELPWDEDNIYLLANNSAHLVWLANLAALEIHIMNSTVSHPNKPNQFIIDLDPPEHWSFEQIKLIANQLKLYLEELGYKVFGKLSGGKGIHLVVPLIPNYAYNKVTKTIKDLMSSFIGDHKNCTLNIQKEKRKGKMLLDIYRNHPGNTIVAPFSLRGKPLAPVSMPLSWEEIMKSNSAKDFTLRKTLSYLEEKGNPWPDFHESAVGLHTHVKSRAANLKLEEYSNKRDFAKTKEPADLSIDADQDVNGKFVVQMHDATNLHFDLRLGQDGVLKSWAIPKGLPVRTGTKRLAIQTEDHPAKYLNFSGEIPKGEYGGGYMWIYDSGEFDWIKQAKNKLEFSLKGSYISAQYKIYRTKDDHWLIELVESQFKDVYQLGIEPMLAGVRKVLPKHNQDFLFEIKWDGIRVVIYKDGKDTRILSRSGRDISDKFTEFVDLKFCKVEHAIFDAELVCLDDQGKPIFEDIISRLHRVGNIQSAIKVKPAYLYVFDCLQINEKNLTSLPLTTRKELMSSILNFGNLVRESEVFEDGKQIYNAARQMGLEGIMAKKKNGKYSVGERSDSWQKIKFRKTMECVIVGYTEGQGDRASLFGALHLMKVEEPLVKYLGKVGTGFDHKKMKIILEKLKELKTTTKPFLDLIEEESKSTWVDAKYYCTVQYASLTKNETLREPVFIKMWLNT